MDTQFPPSSPLISNDFNDEIIDPFSLSGSKQYKDPKQRTKKPQFQFSKLNDNLLRGRDYPSPLPSSTVGRSSSPQRYDSENESEEDDGIQEIQKPTETEVETLPKQKKVSFDIQSPAPKTIKQSEQNIDFNIISPESTIQRIKLVKNTPTLIGRSSKTCNHALSSKNKQISRTHASITYTSENIIIECLGWNGLNLTVPERATIKFLGEKGKFLLIPNNQDFSSFCELNKRGLSIVPRTTKLENNFTNFFILRGERLVLPILNNLILDIRGEICLVELVDDEDTDDELPVLVGSATRNVTHVNVNVSPKKMGIDVFLGKINDDTEKGAIIDRNDMIPTFIIDPEKIETLDVESEVEEVEEAEQIEEIEVESDSAIEDSENLDFGDFDNDLGEIPIELEQLPQQVELVQEEEESSEIAADAASCDEIIDESINDKIEEVEQQTEQEVEEKVEEKANEETGEVKETETVENETVEESTIKVNETMEKTIKKEMIFKNFIESNKENIAPKDKSPIQPHSPISATTNMIIIPTISAQTIKDMICFNAIDSPTFQIHSDSQSTQEKKDKKRKQKSHNELSEPQPKKSKKKQVELQTETDEEILSKIENLSDINKVLTNHLAFSRLSSTPLTFLKTISNITQPIPKITLRRILGAIECIGVIYRSGKDAAGKPLDEEYYYIAEKDTDKERNDLVSNLRGGAGLRNCRKIHKQYFWKKPAK